MISDGTGRHSRLVTLTSGGDVRRLASMKERCIRVAMVATICSGLHAAPSGAQILGGQRPTAKTPPNWFGAGVAIVQPFSLQDGTTSSNWNFDSSIGYMA